MPLKVLIFFCSLRLTIPSVGVEGLEAFHNEDSGHLYCFIYSSFKGTPPRCSRLISCTAACRYFGSRGKQAFEQCKFYYSSHIRLISTS
ncbi:hypothetical protein EZV62_013798 [Acer yangbiense]|uniref:Secreted protein n=1 Tax=Acer yangbiense TaxID=1000413 RepID=A0A5C7HR08_9ROSI|nr:hypothetical protein EZV62_013798 [Acer yangbiense]